MTGEISGIIKKNKGLRTLLHREQGCVGRNSCTLRLCPHPDTSCKRCALRAAPLAQDQASRNPVPPAAETSHGHPLGASVAASCL